MITRSNFDSRKIEHISITHLISYGSVPWPHSHTGQLLLFISVFFLSFRSSSANRRFVSIISFSVNPLQFLLYNRLREVTFIVNSNALTTIKIPNIKSRQRRGSFLSSFERRWSLLMCVLFVMFVFLLIYINAHQPHRLYATNSFTFFHWDWGSERKRGKMNVKN